jgi:head-tail adaptor
MGLCCDYSSGILREAVTFQRETATAGVAGTFTKAWATVSGAPTRAHVRGLSGREERTGDRTDAVARLRVVVRYSAALREGDRVLIRTRAHNITRIDNVEFRDQWLEIDAEAGVAT